MADEKWDFEIIDRYLQHELGEVDVERTIDVMHARLIGAAIEQLRQIERAIERGEHAHAAQMAGTGRLRIQHHIEHVENYLTHKTGQPI